MLVVRGIDFINLFQAGTIPGPYILLTSRKRERSMSAAKKASAPGHKAELYRKLVATNPKIEEKGATHPYTSVNGNMFSYLHPSGAMALRLPEAEREKFLKRYKTSLFQAYGVVQKEYVAVPDALLENTRELKKYFDLSYQYVQTLKPKPSRKKS
jgi:TfoX/Sxy family transcriptional regulator of competence genes